VDRSTRGVILGAQHEGGNGRGYFTSEDMAWRVGRELALILGGPRALLMQVAHPLVAAGVAAHSNYREDPWNRLERTMTAVWSIVFGSREEADEAAARVKAVHLTVRGRLETPMGPFPAGTRYSAVDPELLMWVHATLVDTALLVYGSWVRPLSEEDKAAYYEDMKTLARLFGTPDDVIPPTFQDFRQYMEDQLASDEICVTETAREIAETVLRPPVPLPLRPMVEMVNLLTVSLLPPALRRGYGLRWDPAKAAIVATSRPWLRHVVLPLMPDLIRGVHVARRAEGRGGHALAKLLPSVSHLSPNA
jgi:uncharacterized protein (DUF2236 family)